MFNRVKFMMSATMMTCLAGILSVNAANIGGSVQTSYNYNLTIANDSGSNTNVGHSFDPQSGTFTLNNAHLAISGSDSASVFGYAVELDFGSDAAVIGGFSTFQEAYGTYSFAEGFTAKVGKYVTYEGIEVIEGGANPTITRGFLFGLAEPYGHTGAEIAYAGSNFDVHLGAINGWDLLPDNNVVPSYIAKVGLNLGNPLALTVSSIIGPEVVNNNSDMRMSFDATGVTKVLPMTDLWFQVNYGMEPKEATGGADDASWLGFGVQPVVHINDLIGVGVRYEYFMDDQRSRTPSISFGAPNATDLTVQNITVTPTFWLTKNLTARAEWRMDFANEDIFSDSDSKPTGTQMQVAADVVASF